ncbi:RagB/SusD family nutrient uptake outer membrane protein [Ilyomonas limi]|uniref:RagB/SusD family nutrient uptake outer membrane protein n=1 Tax=Ilyomonas limi TaxID=2575867 RepID=A0A4U3LA44_9BACT|nr:RagB/SusD family nutrient uptake outer membrane protein [Ilyomonas limi]TKK72020.1 RagB/SusD family nutrient uptake outer membrane protein [Ilyomonas limi]
MKKLSNYILLSVIIFSIASCKKFLDVTPQGVVTEENVSTPGNVDGLVLSAYAWIPHGFILNQKMSPWLADIKSDDSYKGGGGIGDQIPWYQWEVFSLNTPSTGNNDGIWYGQYEGVSRCNTALRALNTIDEAAYPLKQQRIAEVRFLRGYLFLDLKKWYKWIPYFDENVTNDSIAKIPNHPDTAQNDLYLWQHIYDDFAAAAAVLPESQAEAGRPTKYAAKAEMLECLMWMAYEQNDQNQVVNINQNRLSEALTIADEIINSGKYSLAPDFAENFLYSFDNSSPESIFEWQYTHGDGTPNGNLNGGTPLNAPWWPPYFSCCDFHKASYDMVNAFRVDENGIPLFDNFNNAEITNKQSYFATNDWDPRIGHTVAIPGLPWKYQQNLLFDSSGARDPNNYGYFNSLKENVESDCPGLVNLFWMWNSKNEIAIRYDRVLLQKAEILIKLGRAPEALPIINEIRQRAANSTDRLKFANGTPTLPYKISLYQDGVNCHWTPDFAWKALMWEDRLEFAMEGVRWYDLVRWGIAEPTLNAYFAKEFPRNRPWMKDGHFTAGRDEFMPIPQPQMNYSFGVYKQNPGY